jgi:hypothetical protein
MIVTPPPTVKELGVIVLVSTGGPLGQVWPGVGGRNEKATAVTGRSL